MVASSRLSLSLFTVSAFTGALVSAIPANDWSVPCFHGECAYDLPDAGHGSGIFQMIGSPRAMTDITPAAGWVILDCDPHALNQDIRLVCQSEDHEGCKNLFAHDGPVGKVVRLPESCGAGPFVRIASASVAQDQNIPDHSSHRVVRRDGFSPNVINLSVDTDFQKLDSSGRGDVHWRLVAANAQLPVGALNHEGLLARDDTKSWFQSALVKVAKAVVLLAEMAAPNSYFGAEGNSAKATVPFNKTWTIFDRDLSCSGAKVGVKLELAVKSVTTGYIGFVATGKAGKEPETDNMATVFRLTVDADAEFHLMTKAVGRGKWPLPIPIKVPMSPIDIKGIVRIGPELVIQAYTEADLEISTDSTFGAHFDLDLQYVIPNRYKDMVKSILSEDDGTKPKDTSLTFSAAGEAIGELNVKSHLVPKISVGIAAFGHNADLYIQTDIWGGLYVVGKGYASASATIKPKRDYIPPQAIALRGLDAANAPAPATSGSLASKLPVQASGNATAGFTGSVVVSAGIDFTAGAELAGKFVGFFKALADLPDGDDKNKIDKTFQHSKSWELWRKDYSAGKAAEKASAITQKALVTSGKPLECPTTKTGQPVFVEKGLKLLSNAFKSLTKK